MVLFFYHYNHPRWVIFCVYCAKQIRNSSRLCTYLTHDQIEQSFPPENKATYNWIRIPIESLVQVTPCAYYYYTKVGIPTASSQRQSVWSREYMSVRQPHGLFFERALVLCCFVPFTGFLPDWSRSTREVLVSSSNMRTAEKSTCSVLNRSSHLAALR